MNYRRVRGIQDCLEKVKGKEEMLSFNYSPQNKKKEENR